MDSHSASSPRSYVVAAVLYGVFFTVGVHHFYVGRWLHGLLDLGLFVATVVFFFGSVGAASPGMWLAMAGLFYVVDLVHTAYFGYKLIVGEYRDGNGRLIPYPGQRSA